MAFRFPTRGTSALVVVDGVRACAAVGTGHLEAVVDVRLANGPHEAGDAEASERVDIVNTGSGIQTRIFGTVVDVNFAIIPFEASSANAAVPLLIRLRNTSTTCARERMQ